MLNAVNAYHQFLEKLTLQIDSATEQYQDQMVCKAGCSACCRGDFKITLVEGIVAKEAVKALPTNQQQQIEANLNEDDPTRCPLLIDDRCSIYDKRPTLCRIFGFPIATGNNIATCELNFTDAQGNDFTASAFDKAAISTVLQSISRLFLTETGQPLPEQLEPPTFRIQEILSGE